MFSRRQHLAKRATTERPNKYPSRETMSKDACQRWFLYNSILFIALTVRIPSLTFDRKATIESSQLLVRAGTRTRKRTKHWRRQDLDPCAGGLFSRGRCPFQRGLNPVFLQVLVHFTNFHTPPIRLSCPKIIKCLAAH